MQPSQENANNPTAKLNLKGVNTGFGGSADTRTKEVEELQATLIRELHCGVLVKPSTIQSSRDDITKHSPWKGALPNEDPNSDTCMPEAWARASILVRINSLASGYSGVRPILINNMVDLLRKDIIPRIPLRGSISASGDLMPLSYIGGTLEGKRSLTVWFGNRVDRRIVTADIALAESSLDPILLGPKEGLAIINGTAVSTGVSALAMHDANGIAVLSQVLAAMSVEALRGTDESFDPFFATVRAHPGQIEAARNIRSFLTESQLVQRNHGLEAGTLRQDRYAIRTASQWLGPVLEDLRLASQQITIECNSVTDNPLIDIDQNHAESARILHGGNFQAKAITSAMEKVRLAVQTMGQMLFAQCTEIINPRLNYGLPPNLSVDEPSQSFLLKPVDIMIAALQSELGFLSNPAGTHVQSAEMGNQALNSLGLISARYTHIALDVLSQLASAHLFTLCQALDLRAMHWRFLDAVKPILRARTTEILASIVDKSTTIREAQESPLSTRPLERSFNGLEIKDEPNGQDGGIGSGLQDFTASNVTADPLALSLQSPFDTLSSSTQPLATPQSKPLEPSDENLPRPTPPSPPSDKKQSTSLESLHSLLWKEFTHQLDQTTTLDSNQRFATIFRSLQPIILDFTSSPETLPAVKKWTAQCSTSALEIFLHNRDDYHAQPDASPLLGSASRRMYKFVREELRVPFLRTSMLRTQNSSARGSNDPSQDRGTGLDGAASDTSGLTVGELITKIYQSIRAGALFEPVMKCLLEVEKMEKKV